MNSFSFAQQRYDAVTRFFHWTFFVAPVCGIPDCLDYARYTQRDAPQGIDFLASVPWDIHSCDGFVACFMEADPCGTGQLADAALAEIGGKDYSWAALRDTGGVAPHGLDKRFFPRVGCETARPRVLARTLA